MISVSISPPNGDLAALWDDLVRHASSNVFMNPQALCAATETDFANIHVLLARDHADDCAGGGRIVGLWALQTRRIAPMWPQFLEALPYTYAFLSSPVVDPALVDVVMPAFLAAIARSPTLPKLVSLPSFDTDTPSYPALLRALQSKDRSPLTVARAARPVATREDGVKRSGATRKKLRQDWNRLSACGAVDIVNDRTPAGVQTGFETFLALEAASWKGARGTALLCADEDARFSRRLLHRMAARGDASVALLRVDGRPIAAQVLLYCGSTAYTWKIGYDADFAKYSPGALLVARITDELFADPNIAAIDSCSAESGFMAKLWTGRHAVVDQLIDVGPNRSLGFVLEAARRLGFQRLRHARDRLKGHSIAFSRWAAARRHPTR